MGLAIVLAAVAAMAGPTTSGTAPGTTDCADNPAISWRVEGGFATFRPEAAARGDALLDAIAAAGGRMQPSKEGQSSAYDAIVATLADQAPTGTTPLYRLTWWDRAAERYELGDALAPPTLAIRATFAAGGAGDCQWSIDGVASAGPCADTRLALPRRGDRVRAAITVRGPGGTSARGCAAVEERLIVGLGDSYASGEGNPDQPTRWSAIRAVARAPRVAMPADSSWRARDRMGLWHRRPGGLVSQAPAAADAQWWDNVCHRSLLSQQALGAMGYAAADRHRRVMFLSFACSGATIFDGVAGPRLEAPGAGRPDGRPNSPALRYSQLEQLIAVLCPKPLTESLDVPAAATIWRNLKINGRRATRPRSVQVSHCPGPIRTPDALLLSVGGNDIGFGGVGAWALLPEDGRLRHFDLVPTINKVFGGGAAKGGFGLICPGADQQDRCGFTTDALVKELSTMLGFLDTAIGRSGLTGVPVKLHSSYPLVTHAETGRVRGCFGDELGGERYELLDEPWLPAYANLLELPIAPDTIYRWSFGIQQSEMVQIDRDVLAKLNNAVAGHRGWTIVPPQAMPTNHGICAADGRLAGDLQAGTTGARVRADVLAQFGWPRFVNHGWSTDRPAPTDWRPYEVRARWVRTATDSALTQSVFDHVGKPLQHRSRKDRLAEAISGGIHPALPLHAAIGEELAARLDRALP